jgi:hypothetical protein
MPWSLKNETTFQHSVVQQTQRLHVQLELLKMCWILESFHCRSGGIRLKLLPGRPHYYHRYLGQTQIRPVWTINLHSDRPPLVLCIYLRDDMKILKPLFLNKHAEFNMAQLKRQNWDKFLLQQNHSRNSEISTHSGSQGFCLTDSFVFTPPLYQLDESHTVKWQPSPLLFILPTVHNPSVNIRH